MRWLFVVFAALFLAAAPPAPAAAQQIEAGEGMGMAETRWEGLSSWHDGETKYWSLYFRRDGVLIYSYDGNTYDNGRWIQRNQVVTFNTNNYFAVYAGLANGQALRGSSYNQRGSTGTFVFIRQ